jgi:hypothetical protein
MKLLHALDLQCASRNDAFTVEERSPEISFARPRASVTGRSFIASVPVARDPAPPHRRDA